MPSPYLDGPNVISSEAEQFGGDVGKEERHRRGQLLDLRWRKGPQAKGCGWSLENGKGKEADLIQNL